MNRDIISYAEMGCEKITKHRKLDLSIEEMLKLLMIADHRPFKAIKTAFDAGVEAGYRIRSRKE